MSEQLVNPILTELDGEEYILCDCMKDKLSVMVPITDCVKYDNKYYCKDCPFITDKKDTSFLKNNLLI